MFIFMSLSNIYRLEQTKSQTNSKRCVSKVIICNYFGALVKGDNISTL